MNNKKVYVINIIFMIILIAAAFYILLKDQDIDKITRLLKKADLRYVLGGIVAVTTNFALQALSLYIILKAFGEKISYAKNLKLTFVGYFYNAITPSAGGGQPMQVYYLTGDKVSVGVSSVALIFWTTLFKTALIVIQAVFLLFHHKFMFKTLGAYNGLYFLGLGINLLGMAINLIVIYWTNGVKWLMSVVSWILKKLRFVKNEEKHKKKIQTMLESYAECSKYVGKGYGLTFTILAITIIQRLAYFSVTWFALRAIGVDNQGFLKVLILQSIVAVCIDIMPVPGGAGLNEGFFVTIFNKYIRKRNAFSAMIISRGITFYLMVIVGAVCAIVSHTQHMSKKAKRKKVKDVQNS